MPLAHTYETLPGPGLADRLRALADRAVLDVAGEGFEPASISFVVGLEHTGGHDLLRVESDAWDDLAERLTAPPGESLLEVRLQGIVPLAHASLTAAPVTDTPAVPRGERTVYRPGGPVLAAVYDRAGLAPGACLRGPALVEATDATIVVPEDFRLSVDGYGTAILEPGCGVPPQEVVS